MIYSHLFKFLTVLIVIVHLILEHLSIHYLQFSFETILNSSYNFKSPILILPISKIIILTTFKIKKSSTDTADQSNRVISIYLKFHIT